jgi:hypothetical protein
MLGTLTCARSCSGGQKGRDQGRRRCRHPQGQRRTCPPLRTPAPRRSCCTPDVKPWHRARRWCWRYVGEHRASGTAAATGCCWTRCWTIARCSSAPTRSTVLAHRRPGHRAVGPEPPVDSHLGGGVVESGGRRSADRPERPRLTQPIGGRGQTATACWARQRPPPHLGHDSHGVVVGARQVPAARCLPRYRSITTPMPATDVRSTIDVPMAVWW